LAVAVGSAQGRLGLLVLALPVIALSCARGPAPPDPAALGDVDPAVRALIDEHTAAVNEVPSSADRWGTLGMAYEGNGFTGPAREAYRTATTFENDHGRWWYRLAILAQRNGDTDAALAAFDRAIALSPDVVAARWRRGLLLLDRGDLDAAEAAFKVAANLAPNDSAGVTGLARVLMARGHVDQAATRLEALLERSPVDRYAY
jgi:tetratricopeptide (TPR) repeat protein